MTRDELMNEKQYLDVTDFMKMYQCGKDKAYVFIREIKNVSSLCCIQGKVTISDYQAWLASAGKKNSGEVK